MLVFTVAAAMTIGAVTSSAAGPLPVNAAGLKSVAPNDVVIVRARRGQALVAGIALGLIGTAIAASAAEHGYYYGPVYYYAPYPPVYYYPPYYQYRYYTPYWGPPVYRVYPPYRHYRYYYRTRHHRR